jgi:hypothetical protein
MITQFKIFEFWFNNDLPEYDLEELIPLDIIYKEFNKYAMSCDPEDNKSNGVEYYDDEIVCYATSFALDGNFDDNNLEHYLSVISEKLNADAYDWNVIMVSNNILKVKFRYDDLEELSSKINADKYNL